MYSLYVHHNTVPFHRVIYTVYKFCTDYPTTISTYLGRMGNVSMYLGCMGNVSMYLGRTGSVEQNFR